MPKDDPKLELEEIQEFFDGRLGPERRRKIARMIKEDSLAIRQLADYAAQNKGMHSLFDFVLDEPIPDRFLKILEEYPDGTESRNSDN